MVEAFLGSKGMGVLAGAAHLHPKTVKTLDLAFQHLRENMKVVKEVVSEDNRRCRNTVLNTMVGQETQQKRLQRSTASLMGLHYKNIHKAVEKRVLATANPTIFPWCGGGRAKRCDALTPECKEDIVAFWIANTSVSSNTKDMRYRTAKDFGNFEKRALQFLLTTHVSIADLNCLNAIFLLFSSCSI